MDLKKKLAYYKKAGQEGDKADDTIQSPPAVPPSVKALLEHFDAQLLEASATAVLKMQNEFPCSHNLQESVSISRLSKRQITQPIDLNQCLFFDLETTGLSAGTGTYPFLLGFGYFVEGRFRIVQYFLPDFGREYHVFKDISPLFNSKRYLISYNGKSYDLPLLKTRAVMNRLSIDFDRLIHIDLLHLTRRVWKDSQERCDLNSVEAFQLGLRRTTDIPGWQIPQAYLNFLRTGGIHEMIAAIEHNVQDIYSLAKLLVRLSEIEQQPEILQDTKALMRLAHLALEIEDFPFFQRIAERIRQEEKRENGQLTYLKSRFLKKLRDWPRAVAAWQALLENPSYRFYALQELAKYYEHHKKNIALAITYCDQALRRLKILEELNPYAFDRSLKEAFLKRKERLKRKIS